MDEELLGPWRLFQPAIDSLNSREKAVFGPQLKVRRRQYPTNDAVAIIKALSDVFSARQAGSSCKSKNRCGQ